MAALLDSATVEALIEDGRRRELSSKAIAEQIVALVDNPAWVKAMAHPSRGKILDLLRKQGKLSPTAAVTRLDGESLGTISYHFRHLAKLGLVEVCDTIPRRGAIEHVYRLTAAPESMGAG
jgi:hypothetical protein